MRRILCSIPLCCPNPGVEHDATHVIQWRTPHMAAPAFWYVCEHAKDKLVLDMNSIEAVRALRADRDDILVEVRKLSLDLVCGVSGRTRMAMQLGVVQEKMVRLDTLLQSL